MGYVAVLDANVLHPWILCDILLRLAERGLFRPVWSSEILEEVVRSIGRRRPDLPEDRVRHRVDRMNASFPNAMISDYEPVRSAVPAAVHAGDIHVVATAIVEMAQDTRRPPLTPAQVLESLTRVAPDFAGLVGLSGSPMIADKPEVSRGA